MYYPAKFAPEDGGYNVTFRDIPEAITCGDNFNDALQMAQDCLITAIDFYFEDRRIVPPPSEPQEGEVLIELPPSVVAKVFLMNEIARQKIANVELAQRIGVKPQEMRRITSSLHTTKIDTLHKALKALGKDLILSVK